MNIKERIEAVLMGRSPDRMPFTIYPMMLPRSEAERKLRNKGLGLSVRTDVIKWVYPNCEIVSRKFNKDGIEHTSTVWITPVGEVRYVTRDEGGYGTGSWIIERPVKSKNDYKVVEYITNDAIPVPFYDAYKMYKEQVGNDGYVIGQLGYSPLMEMIVNLIGTDRYAYELYDNADDFWALYECLCKKMRRAYPVVANSPAELVLYCGNIHPDVVGLERLESYILPCIHELADALHEKGKLVGVHFDANTQLFKKAIANSSIDVIEAFTPPPDCDMPLWEALKCWQGKKIWLNFPSSVHIEDTSKIQEVTVELLKESSVGNDVIFGVTEDIPSDCWPRSLNAICDAINQYDTSRS